MRRRIISGIAVLLIAFTGTAVAAQPALADPNYPCWWSVGGPNNQYQLFQNCLPGRAKIQIKFSGEDFAAVWCTPYGQAWVLGPADQVEWKTILGFYAGPSCV
jgi:hypothetical protein